jgi:hypothetical protein
VFGLTADSLYQMMLPTAAMPTVATAGRWATAIRGRRRSPGRDDRDSHARNPASAKFQTWIIPSGGGVIRHMMATRAGNLVLACSGVNRVALVEVKGN